MLEGKCCLYVKSKRPVVDVKIKSSEMRKKKRKLNNHKLTF